jgi:hypothetical protein
LPSPAVLWWIVFGTGDDEGLALSALFYGFIPLLGLVAMAAGVLRSVILAAEQPAPALPLSIRAGQAAIVAGGAALYLAGDVIIRMQLGTGPVRLLAMAAAVVPASIAVGVAAGLEAQLAVVTAVLIAPLIAEHGPARGEAAGSGPARTDAAG